MKNEQEDINPICKLCIKQCKQNSKCEVVWCRLYVPIDKSIPNPFEQKRDKKKGRR